MRKKRHFRTETGEAFADIEHHIRMKRTLIVSALAVALLAAWPAGADPEAVVRGRIDVATLSPTIPRTMYLATPRTNGTAGWVASLPVSDTSRTFEIQPLEASAGLDLDVWFYRDLAGQTGMGDPCARDATPLVGGGERGTVCAGAAYAVVVLFSGADVPFELHVA